MFKSFLKPYLSKTTFIDKMETFFFTLLIDFGYKYLMNNPDDNKGNDSYPVTPEVAWDLFLTELDHLFNTRGIVLSHALSTASATVASRFNVYVLEDPEFKEFSYHEIIVERVRQLYALSLDTFFNQEQKGYADYHLIARENVIDALQITNKDLDELMETYNFGYRDNIAYL